MTSSSDDFDGMVERILTFLHLCEESKKHHLYVPLSSMDGAVPMALAEARSITSPEFMIPINDGKPALWPVDVRAVKDANLGIDNPIDQWPDGTLHFRRIRSIQTKEARAFGASVFSPFMVMDQSVFAKPDGAAQSALAPLSMVSGNWVNAAPKSIVGVLKDGSVPALLGFALALRYEWSVWIGYNEGPRVRFLTDPLGVREIFRLRDIPSGRDRRAALRHWVSAHARRRHPDMNGEALAWVRRHMRGATDFTWNGLRCRIQPDAYELEQIAAQDIK